MLRCLPALNAAIKEIDGAYDSCNEAWAVGESEKFQSKKFLDSNHCCKFVYLYSYKNSYKFQIHAIIGVAIEWVDEKKI